jgi:hypothetical protein
MRVRRGRRETGARAGIHRGKRELGKEKSKEKNS